MTLNATGPISLAGTTAGQSIEVELGGTGTTQISLNDASVRTLAGVASGAITMPTNFYGKANRVSLNYTFAANTANATLNVTSISGYIAGKSDITITVNSGIYLYSTSTANAGLTLSGGTTGDTITLINNGYIMGQGGAGGAIGVAATAGETALSLGFNTTVNNTNASAYIGGGGGGGGYAYSTGFSTTAGGGGGGAGGGAGGAARTGTAGGGGGTIGNSGSNGTFTTAGAYAGSGGGGGRIFPSTTLAGPVVNGVGAKAGLGNSGGGTGGAGVSASSATATGGSGGGTNTIGGNATRVGTSAGAGGGGGGYGASGGSGIGTASSGAGAAGGKAVALNGKTITWVSGNTTRVYGSVA